ncbi:fucose-1-phosphate guanylyltransferase [Galendromus occidentalis]|uniref:Fucose-1-phosphate guanylyltransferase n=1 Tax=Galendromus occidentalis TaxID=34638 RepID=A0AAJ7L4I6_9ACAR|nr:fucose-1-phosphate guanylyltransferase [Galendromus occidentalis]
MSVHEGFDCTDEMTLIFEQYSALKGLTAAECSGLFWDAVVFSVGDAAQREAIETRIQQLKADKAIPLVDYIALEDDASYKMGSGGATMNILTMLKSLWNEDLFSKKILLIHTGGQCRRLPQHSAVGKLFARLPCGRMLDIKLAMYLPFCRKMSSGVFLTASDDIETFAVDGPHAIEKSGFTVLAHPSNLSIAKDHGVYILPESIYAACTIASCLRVLQKPSLDEMRAANAIVDGDSAFTDSAYVFGADVMRCLIEYYESNRPLNREICAYGDFLTCLGSGAPKSTDSLQRELQKFPIRAIVLARSNFYHIGTLTEYLDNLCSNVLFKKQISIDQSPNINILSRLSAQGVVFRGRCVIECCDFGDCSELSVGDDVILWGCQLQSGKVVVPDRVVLFTVPIKVPPNHNVGYVTLCFGIHDDMKTGTKLFGRHAVENLWTAKLFELANSRSESFLKTLHNIATPQVRESFFSMEDVLEYKFIQGIIEWERTLDSS